MLISSLHFLNPRKYENKFKTSISIINLIFLCRHPARIHANLKERRQLWTFLPDFRSPLHGPIQKKQ